MTIDAPLNFLLPEDLASKMGKRAQARRLAANLSRKTLSLRSGVPVSTLRKFETSGKIGLVALLQLAEALDCLDEFGQMFAPRVLTSIEDFVAPVRQRGSQ
jgi:transcriptional regulator with XRE-family HTH domain